MTADDKRVIMQATLYEQLGGERKLRAIIDDLVARMRDDVLIGFFFARVAPQRLRALEFEHAAAFLGAPIAYSGRPLAQAHARHRIRAGHFARRLVLLGEVLAAHGVAAAVAEPWLTHQRALRGEVVADA